MKTKGLLFGEALPGDYRQYGTLHKLLVDELRRMKPAK